MATVPVFIYEAPFVLDRDSNDTFGYLNDSDKEYESDLRRVCFQFAVKYGIVVPSDAPNEFKQPATVDVNSWIYALNWMNFRSMVDPIQYQSIINRLSKYTNGDQSYPIELSIDLHLRIGCMFDHQFLNVIVDRVMKSISLVPYDVPPMATPKTWKDIHKEVPWFWCLIYLQSLIRTETAK